MLKRHLENLFFAIVYFIIVHVVFIVTVIILLESGADSLCHNPNTIMPGWQPLFP